MVDALDALRHLEALAGEDDDVSDFHGIPRSMGRASPAHFFFCLSRSVGNTRGRVIQAGLRLHGAEHVAQHRLREFVLADEGARAFAE